MWRAINASVCSRVASASGAPCWDRGAFMALSKESIRRGPATARGAQRWPRSSRVADRGFVGSRVKEVRDSRRFERTQLEEPSSVGILVDLLRGSCGGLVDLGDFASDRRI